MENEIQIRRMRPSDKPEVLRMMRVFYDSPAIDHTAPDETLAPYSLMTKERPDGADRR